MSDRPRVDARLVGAGIAVAAILAFCRAAACGWIWDDPEHVTGNVVLRSAAGLRDIWLRPESIPQWYPLVHTTFWVEHHLWGDHAAGYHVLNVLLHALNAVLLWRVLHRLGVPGAWIAGLLFAVHPVHAESVAWVSERKNVLSGAFYLGSLLAWTRAAGLAEDRSAPSRGLQTWALAFLLFVGALLSKSVTATLPAVALVLVWWKRGSITKRDFLPLLPFLVAGIGLGLHTAYMERKHVGAEGADWALSWPDRFVLAGEVLWFYASKLAVPWNLTFIYPRWPVDGGSWWQWLFPIGALGGMAALWANRERIGRGPLAAVLIFAGTLFPALGFLNVYPFRYSWVADHFQYLASAALLALAGAGLARLAEEAATVKPWCRWLVPSVPAAVLAAVSVHQCGMYGNMETLWIRTLERNRAAAMAYNNLAVIRIEQKRYAEALDLVKVAVTLSPNGHEGWNNYGSCLSGFKDYAGAEKAYRKAISIMPGFAMAKTNLGMILDFRGRPDEALAEFRASAALEQSWRGAFEALVKACVDRKLFPEAAETAREAMRRYPRDVRLLVTMGATMNGGEAAQEAIPVLEEAVRRDGGDAAARMELGRARFGLCDLAGAVEEFRESIRIDPAISDTWVNLGTALRRHGDYAGAERALREALRLDPANVAAMADVARLLVRAGRLEDASDHLEKSLATAPGSWRLLHARAALRLAQGRKKEAAADLRDAVRGMPEYAPLLSDLAGLLAGSADPDVRAPEAAVVLAERAVGLSKRKEPSQLDVLASAYASSGRFDEAVRVADEAILLGPPEPLLGTLRAHRALFAERKALAE